MRYLLEDYNGVEKGDPPKLKVIYEKEVFEILQDKPDGIAITKLEQFCVIDWS